MRLWGIGLLIAACILVSLQDLRLRRERIRALGDLAQALRLLQGELSLHCESLPQAFETLACRCDGAGQELFEALARESGRLGEERFEQIWRSCVSDSSRSLRTTERDRLERLGQVLGRMELELQLQALEETCAELREARADAEESFPAERRLSIGLGAAVAALLGIVLL